VLKGRQSPCPYCAVVEAFRTKALVCRPSNPDDAVAKDRSMEVFACPILDDDGEPIGAVEFAWDVTEQKRVQEAVQQEQRQLKRLLDMHERDRKLVAYEVHDGFVQPLTAAKMIFEGHLRALQDRHPDVRPCRCSIAASPRPAD
jgi:signal transduction histidine kinase